MQVIFVRQKGIVPSLIRLFDGGYYNHCAMVTSPGWVTEANAGVGVHAEKRVTLETGSIAYLTLEVPLGSEEDAKRFLAKQMGKSYDYWAVFGLFWKKIFGTAPNLQRSERWFCDELLLATVSNGLGPTPYKPMRNFGIQDTLDWLIDNARATVVEKHTNPIL